MNPTDLARERWKPYRQAQERVEKAAAQHAKAREDLAALEAQLPIAERDDELALGRALVDGKPEPAPAAVKVREEIAAQQRRANGLERVVQEAHSELVATLEENRQPWAREAAKEASKARTRYEAALTELEDARGNLSATVGLFHWASSGGVATPGRPLPTSSPAPATASPKCSPRSTPTSSTWPASTRSNANSLSGFLRTYLAGARMSMTAARIGRD